MLLRPSPRLLLCTLLLLATTVGWRRGAYFDGSLDPVVLAKGVLGVAALVMAFLTASARGRLRVGTGTLWALAVVSAASLLGALTHDTFLASGVVTARVVIVALTVVLLLRVYSTGQFVTALALVSGAVALAAAGTGVSTLSSGRLAGGIPELDPNELALLACLVVLYAAWRVVLGNARLWLAGPAVAGLGIVWATGSRTALLMLVAALAVMALHVRRAPVGLVAGGLALGAVGTLGIATTGALAGFLERDGTGTSTLDSRFIAWGAASDWAESAWQLVFGGGLSVKIIPVKGQYWDEQPLDSSWVSLLVQTGLLGMVVAAVWVVWAFRGALLAPREHRALFLGLLVFLVGRSLLESGLFDATPSFVAFLAVSLLAEGGSRRRLAEELAPPPAARRTEAVPLAG
ncbi:hypothetical protein [Blastococcus sp. SYSU D00820]